MIQPKTTHRMVLAHHSRLGQLYVPGINARVPGPAGPYFLKTNAQGFRSDWDFTKEKGRKPRILVFGDSYTAGDGVTNADRFSEKLGQMYGAEVFNFGVAGTGTDQHLMILEEVARGVKADLVIFCVAVHNIDRIKVGYRKYIERTTGEHVLGAKPYFELIKGKLQLRNVPVPIERPRVDEAGDVAYEQPVVHDKQGGFGLFKKVRQGLGLEKMEKTLDKLAPDVKTTLRTKLLHKQDFQPHEDYRSASSPGWQLMKALIERFHAGVKPTPLLVVPIPTWYFYFDEVPAIYQPLFESLENKPAGIHVMDATSPLLAMPREDRRRLPLGTDTHFSPEGHTKIAEMIASEIDARSLLPGRREMLARSVVGRRRAAEAAALLENGDAPAADANRPRWILGLSCFYHNSAAALIKDGRIVAAAEEERFSRVKNDPRFPVNAINFCLEQGNIQPKDLAAAVYYDNAALTFERIFHTLMALGKDGEDAWMRILPFWVGQKFHIPELVREALGYDGLVLQETHHRSHAASAFYPSPFERAAILTIDGVGEWATATIGVGRGAEMKLLQEMRFPHSLGLLYSAFTQFTGFKVNSGEYKMMGLAPYGEPKYVDRILDKLVTLHDDGSIELNMEYFGFLHEASMTSDKMAELFEGPAREIESRITRREMDMARSVQVVTEEAMIRMARHAHRLTGESKMCLAGGVALNCVANGRVLREGPFEDMWIQPAAGDSGGALGAALDAHHTWFREPRVMPANGRADQQASWWGPGYTNDEIEAFLRTYGIPAVRLAPEERAGRLADLLAEGKILGHFAGRTEFGPRALGARSILGDPRNPDMQARLNLKIKFRESFRPFAPAVLAEKVGDYFELDRESPYMLLVAPVRKERRLVPEKVEGEDMLVTVKQLRSDIPAITHIDYSARVQSATKDETGPYYDIIKAFDQKTGCAVIVNTSFNVRGEPIVNTPAEAYRCFMKTHMDALVLGDFLLLKEDQPATSLVPEPVSKTVNTRELESPLSEELRRIYREEFLPLVTRLDGRGVEVSEKPTGQPTLWRDLHESDDPRAIFQVPERLTNPNAPPAEAAQAMLRYWGEGPVRDAAEPVLARLLALSRKMPLALDQGHAKVHDTIYVMY
ncbi:MAG TPA: carbamoyltransferase N-terminal domain-containing protein [Candidatus Eisenbacteria bacterium]